MTTNRVSRLACAKALRCASLIALVASLAWAQSAAAMPLTFKLINPSSTNVNNQSRLNLTATATLSGAPLTSAPQFAPGGLNGQGSESTTYNQVSVPSNLFADVYPGSVNFPGGSVATANNTTGLFGNLPLKPGVGGVSGTAPGDYGVKFSSPQDIVIPSIDVSSLNLPGITTINLGTLKSIDLNIALRDIVLDVTSGSLPLSPTATYPKTFASSPLTISVAGNADMLLSAFLAQANFSDFLATGAVLTALQSALSGQGIAISSSVSLSPLGYNVGFGFTNPLPITNALNADASNGLLEHVGSNLRMTVPVAFNIQANTLPSPLNTLITANFGLSGKLIGETPFVVVPEPSSIVLSLVGAVGLIVVGRRRLRAA